MTFRCGPLLKRNCVCAADSAFFWADGANTSAITGHWLDIAREVSMPHLHDGSRGVTVAQRAFALCRSLLSPQPVTTIEGYPLGSKTSIAVLHAIPHVVNR
jgi:hypothetical protein